MAQIPRDRFILSALQALPADRKQNGLRYADLAKCFAVHFGDDCQLPSALDQLIREGKVIAIKLEREEGSAGRVIGCEEFLSFPDPNVNEKNPMLYRSDILPAFIHPLRKRWRSMQQIRNCEMRNALRGSGTQRDR